MSLTNPMKVLLAAIVIAIIGLGFWILDWQAKQTTLSQSELELKNKEAELQDKKSKADKIIPLRARNLELKEQLKKEMAEGDEEVIAPDEFVANYLLQINEMVITIQQELGDDSFQLMSITPGTAVQQTVGGKTPDAKASGAPESKAAPQVPEALRQYLTRTFQMQMKGRYETLIDFLDRLGQLKLKRLVTVNRLSLAPESGVDTGRPVLGITIPLTAYLRTGGE